MEDINNQKNIKKITIDSEKYPNSLKKISNPPKVLYYRGIIKKEEPCFAIVGARKCSFYGKQAAFDIAGKLSDAGIIIVSGLAPGIDASSHLSAVKRNKRTIAVLGTGLDEESIYPKENIGLSRKILETGGCLISEYPPKTRGTRFTFPKRNRIISGLSDGILVVESKEKGGSMITANYGLLQKKKLFALPGSIYSFNSKGPHNLIRRGAKIVDKASDIMEELYPLVKNTEKESQINILLTLEANLILKALEKECLHIDEIIKITNLNTSKVFSNISILEIEGKIKNLGGNIYAICKN